MRDESEVPGGALNLISTQTMVTMDIFPFQEKTHMVEPGIEPGTSWLVVRSSDHQATRLVHLSYSYPPGNELLHDRCKSKGPLEAN